MRTAFVSDTRGPLGLRLVDLLRVGGVEVVRGPAAAREADVVFAVGDVDGTGGERFAAMREANVDGLSGLLEDVRPGQRVVLLSSVQVYAPAPWPAQWPVGEHHARRAHGSWPTQVYAQQKIEAENRLARAAGAGGFDYVLLRSDLRTGGEGGLPERVVADAATRPRLALAMHGGLGAMQWVSVDDVCRALVTAGTSHRAAGEAFNIAGDEVVSVGSLVDRFHGASGGATRPWQRFDVSKARKLLGWTAQDGVGAAVRDAPPMATGVAGVAAVNER
jgi:nucleoside-diphosphate-sugar epimerase